MAPVPILVALMLATGITNSLLSKAQDQVCVGNCDDPDPRRHLEYAQPVWQTLNMFVGEMLCLVPVLLRELHGLLVRYRAQSRAHTPLVNNPAQSSNSYGSIPPTPAAVEPSDPLAPNNAEGASKAEDEPLIHGRATLLFFLPALCDIVGTTLMNVGLILTPVSIYQYV